jgi:two-component system, OmpR family, response regulator
MSSFHVLLVDDEPDIREAVEISLGLDADFEGRSCACGAVALMEAVTWGPTVILCDAMMPGMDGPTTLARLRENRQTAKIPVILITACVQRHEAEHLQSLGAAGLICKPFDPMALADQIRSQIRAIEMADVPD